MITAGPDGNIWFTSYDAIGRITTSGVVSPIYGVDRPLGRHGWPRHRQRVVSRTQPRKMGGPRRPAPARPRRFASTSPASS